MRSTLFYQDMEQGKPQESKVLALAPVVAAVLKEKHPDKRNAVKSDDLIFYLKAIGTVIRGQDLRAIIGHIRQQDLLKPGFIISDVHTGYWYSTDKAEMDAFIDQQMNRMSNQFDNIKALHQRMRHNNKQASEIQSSLF